MDRPRDHDRVRGTRVGRIQVRMVDALPAFRPGSPKRNTLVVIVYLIVLFAMAEFARSGVVALLGSGLVPT